MRLLPGSALLERGQELEALEALLARAGRGTGALAVVRGPPGAGKTSLMTALRAAAGRAGLTALEARGAELEQGFAFGVVRQLLEPTVTALEGGARTELFADAAAHAARIFDAGRSDGDGGFATLHGLYWLVVHLADRGPLLVAVDDCHWADPQSLEFLNYLAHRVDSLPLTVVLAGRPPDGSAGDELWARLAALPAAVALHPQPLSEDAVGTLIGDRLGPAAVDDLRLACHAATGGNPLFLRELLGALEAAETPPTASAVRALGPAAVSRFVLHRLAGLGADATALARAAAVLGDGGDLRDAAVVAGLPEDAARRAADALVRADVLVAAEQLAFVHPIVAAAIYDELTPGERQRLHVAAAGALAGRSATAERVAAHLLRSGPTIAARDVGILRAAAENAAGRGAPDAAAVYLRRVLEQRPSTAGTADEVGSVLTELGRCELAAMQFSAADEHLRAAVAAGGATRADAASLLARCAIVSGGRSADGAAATLATLIADLEPDEPARALALGSDLLILGATVPRLRTELPAWLAEFSRQARSDPRFGAVARIHAANEELLRGGSAATTVEEVRDALASGLPPEAATTLFVAISALTLGESYEPASLMLDAVLEAAREQGHVARQSMVLGQRAAIALARGALDDAQVDADTGLGLIDERHFVLPQLGAVVASVQLERGDLAAASAALERGGILGEAEDRMFLDQFLISRGRLRIAEGDLRGGVAELLRCGERRAALGLHWPSDWRAYAVPAVAALGEVERATALAHEQVALARQVGAAGALGRSLWTAAAAAARDEELALLEEAVAVLEPSPARLELAHALFGLGRTLSRRKRRREGREALRVAVEVAQRCGARALAERARAELTAGGGRPPRLQRTGAAALTPAERRVCELAATEQLTNRAIAQRLFVTEKTVELHLSNAYRKLGIRSRFQLAGPLGG